MGKKSSNDQPSLATVHIECKIEGEPAEFLLELKRRGIVFSAREAVVQGIICLGEKSCRGICFEGITYLLLASPNYLNLPPKNSFCSLSKKSLGGLDQLNRSRYC